MKLKLINLLSGYENVSSPGKKTAPDGGKRRYFTRRMSGNLSYHAENGGSARASRNIFNITAHTASRAYGALILSFAVLTMLLSSGIDFLIVALPGDRRDFIIGLGAAVLSLPFFFFEGPVITAVERHKILSEIVFDFFCIKRPTKGKDERGIPLVVCIAIGVILAVAGFFTSAYIVALSAVGVAFAYLSFVSPEFSLFSCILALPAISMLSIHNYIACFVAAVMLLSYLRKVAFGKRNYNFEQYDLIIGLMMLCVLISGIFVGGASSFEFCLVIIGSTSVYFTTGNIITNPRLLDCMTRAFIYSSVLPALTAVVQFALLWSRIGFAEAFDMGVAATFISADSFACFLIVPVCFAFMYARQKRSLHCFLIGALDCLALFMCGNFFAPIAILTAFIVYVLIKAKKSRLVPAFLILALPYVVALLPITDTLSFIIGDNIAETLKVWGASLSLVGKNLLLGVGLSPEAFSAAFSTVSKIQSIDARNLFIDMAARSGILTVVFFSALLVSRLFHRAAYGRYLAESTVADISAVSSVTVIAFIIFGSFNQMFTDISLYYIFFSAFAVGSATLRIACAEHDDRASYFRDASQSHSAAVDVDLNGFMQN